MIRAVIDTNVLVSALISPDGNEALVLLAINQGLVRPCYSAEILHEYADVLIRPKFGFSEAEVNALVQLLRKHGEQVESGMVAPVSSDPSDDKFIGCALSSKSDFLVTGNKRHYPVPKLGCTKLANAAELIAFITAAI